jgi:hypothetical protein
MSRLSVPVLYSFKAVSEGARLLQARKLEVLSSDWLITGNRQIVLG